MDARCIGRSWAGRAEIGDGYLDIDGADLVRAGILGEARDRVEAREI